MKKLLIVAAVAIIATASFYEKNKNEVTEQTVLEDVQVALAEQMVESFEQTFEEQLNAFMKNDDFSQMVGWSEEEKQQLTDSLQEYLISYEWDTKQLVELKDKVTELLSDSDFLKSLKGITKEELDAKLAGILAGQSTE